MPALVLGNASFPETEMMLIFSPWSFLHIFECVLNFSPTFSFSFVRLGSDLCLPLSQVSPSFLVLIERKEVNNWVDTDEVTWCSV